MSEDGLPNEVRMLIADHIVSVEQLDILLLLHRHPDQAWSVDAVAEQIRTSQDSAADRLADLAKRGFLACIDKNPHTYRYAPADPKRAQALDMLAQIYPEKPYTVIDLIFSKPIDKLRVYADAFRFKKDDSDG